MGRNKCVLSLAPVLAILALIVCASVPAAGATAKADNLVKVTLSMEDGAPFSGANLTATSPDGEVAEGVEIAPGAYLLKGSDMTKSMLEIQDPKLGPSSLAMPIGLDTEVNIILRQTDGGEFWADRIIPQDLRSGYGGTPMSGASASMLAPPANDDCANAITVAIPSSTGGTTTEATNDSAGTCVTSNTRPGVWYKLIGNGRNITVDLCTGTTWDSKLSVYTNGCSTRTCVTGNDDSCGLQSRVTFCANAGQEYLILVHQYSTSGGAFTLTVTDGASCGPPANDTCANAQSVSTTSTTNGDTSFAAVDAFPACSGVSVTAPGVWYKVVGNGTQLTATTCASTGFDTKLSVYCRDCARQVCVTGNDDATCSYSSLRSTVSWCSEPGATYLILVHGYSSAKGPFVLQVSQGSSCSNYPAGCVPTGACCVAGAPCAIVKPAVCGGSYVGDDTNCGGIRSYQRVAGGGAFEDISTTGTTAPSADDADDGGSTVPVGFSFNFYNAAHTTIGITSNGYLTFGTALTDYSNDPIPSTNTPNDLIATLWDDLDTRGTPTVKYQTIGRAPRRHFIGQWTNVPELGGSTYYTFQAVLFERENCIEFRYQQYTPESYAGDFTIGLEDPAGATGLSVAPASIRSGDTIRFCPLTDPNPCNHPPTANAGGPYTAECQGAETRVPLDGSGSTDPDNDPLFYEWSTDCPGYFDDETATNPTLVVTGAPCSLNCTVTLTVFDPYDGIDSIDAPVTVQDTTAPVIDTIPGDLYCLWSPNHTYICMDASYFNPTVTEACSPASGWYFTSCGSDQPDNDLGDGDTTQDCIVSADRKTVCMRSERQGTQEPGRRYLLMIQATDDCGNVSNEGVMGSIWVPHNTQDPPMGCMDASALGCRKGDPLPCR